MVIKYTPAPIPPPTPLPSQGADLPPPPSYTPSASSTPDTTFAASIPDTPLPPPTEIQRSSSSISGHYNLSTRLALRTSSGSISITVTLLTATAKSELITESTSGSVDVTVLPLSSYSCPAKSYADGEKGKVEADAALRKLFGRHVSTSGSVTVRYPQGWEGEIRASSVSGSLNVKGRDVIIERDVTEGGRRVVKASKGKGEGVMVVETSSGTVNVFVGDD